MLAALSPLPSLAEHQRDPEREEGREVRQLHEPMAGVGEYRVHHAFAVDSRYRPRQVNDTITSSMTTCERTAAPAEP